MQLTRPLLLGRSSSFSSGAVRAGRPFFVMIALAALTACGSDLAGEDVGHAPPHEADAALIATGDIRQHELAAGAAVALMSTCYFNANCFFSMSDCIVAAGGQSSQGCARTCSNHGNGEFWIDNGCHQN